MRNKTCKSHIARVVNARKRSGLAAEDAVESAAYFLGERGVARTPPGTGLGRRRIAGPAAVEAFNLAQTADQVGTRAALAAVERGGPVRGSLAIRADQDELVTPYAAAPRTLPAGRVGLPGAAAVTGHGY